jgi:membrane protein
MFMKLKQIGELFAGSYNKWQSHNAARAAAALSYYALFSIAPLLIVAVAVAGFFLGTQTAQDQLNAQIHAYLGEGTANLILGMVDTATKPNSGLVASVIGLLTIIMGASGLFGELQADLNTMWDVQVNPPKNLLAGILDWLRNRLVAFLLVLGVGILLLASSLISVVLSAFGNVISSQSSYTSYIVLQTVSFVVSFAIATVAFAIIYRVLPNTFVSWSDVWIGAAFTSFLFNIGRLLIGLYLGAGTATSTYGAAGSLVALLLWVNYSAQIFLFGAEFTHVYAGMQGSRTPEGAIKTQDERAQSEKSAEALH